MRTYAHPEVLVETEWVRQNLGRPGVRLVEIDLDTQAYEAGHIPGSVAFNWRYQLQDQVQRDIISVLDFEKLAGNAGILPQDTVIVYGDNHNWFAAYGFWLFKLYDHADVRLMNGGRNKWLGEPDRPLTVQSTKVNPVTYRVAQVHEEFRARLSDALDAATSGEVNLVDVRTPDEFTGKIIAPAGMTETAQRGGHIPGARNVPWNFAVNPDGTFKSVDELSAIYLGPQGIDPSKETIAYCRIGERSSHTWFVLHYLLGMEDVRNYDGSWTEYGSLIGVPIEK
ncbi:MAG: sulfurtransferase [Candidatus Omnitrophica bacterium]|nr:sulfurtransferase [Candidatus Omnitrophota bacterium]